MQFMADFLLEHSSKQSAAKTKQSALDTNTRGAANNAPQFSNIYAQQQQARSLAAKKEPIKPAQPVQQSQPKAASKADTRTTPSAEKSVARNETPSSDKPAEAAQSDEAGAAANQRHSQEIDSQAGNPLPPEEETGKESLVAQMDPLLLQIMQAQQSAAQPGVEEQVAELLGEEQAELAVLGVAGTMTALSSVSTDKQGHSAIATTLQSVLQGAADEPADSEEAGLSELGELDVLDVLDVTAEGEEPVNLRQVLAQAGVTQASQETKQSTAQVAGEAKVGVENTAARSDTLLRTESVQQGAAARQVPGAPVTMQHPGWSKEVTDKVMWMSSQNLKSAEIKLNPAELGRLDIRVQIANEHTQVTFTSAHAGVRESLESQSFRLRELMEQQGMQNVDVNVADQSDSDQQDERELRALMAEQGSGRASHEEDDTQQVVTEVPLMESGHSGRVSYYV